MTNLDTLSTKELVKHYNALVTASHPTVACIAGVWKASKAALIAKIKDLPKEPVKADREEMLKSTTEALKAKAGEELNTEAAKDAFTLGKGPKSAQAKPAKEKAAPKEKVAKKGQSDPAVGEYIAKHGLNPKIVRAKLRRAGFSAPYTLAQVEGLSKKD